MLILLTYYDACATSSDRLDRVPRIHRQVILLFVTSLHIRTEPQLQQFMMADSAADLRIVVEPSNSTQYGTAREEDRDERCRRKMHKSLV